jgi:hypothetical protein
MTFTLHTNKKLISAKNDAIQFLIKNRKQDGLWADFQTVAGRSDEWVTGYVGNSLALFGETKGHIVANNALTELLKRQVVRIGWGYNQFVPPDADSTLWILRLDQSLCYSNSTKQLKGAYTFLEKHIHQSGGVATYVNSVKLKLYRMLVSKKMSFTGWCMPHICVSAAFSLLNHPKQKAALEFIRQNQHNDGSWSAYWYVNPEYTTALAVEALSKTGIDTDFEKCQRAASWAESRVEISLFSPFIAALNLRILLASNLKGSDVAHSLISYLLSSQQPDGGWESSTFLRIPRPDETDPDSYKYWLFDIGHIGSIQKDITRLFTTATVLTAIGIAIGK